MKNTILVALFGVALAIAAHGQAWAQGVGPGGIGHPPGTVLPPGGINPGPDSSTATGAPGGGGGGGGGCTPPSCQQPQDPSGPSISTGPVHGTGTRQ